MARVLVVEDDTDVANLLAHRLRAYGHTVAIAQSGRLALTSVGVDFPIEIAVIDFHLPGMDGFELLEQLRRHPELENPRLPCVILTGDTTEEPQQRAKTYGVACLAKPFVSGELQGAILSALSMGAQDT